MSHETARDWQYAFSSQNERPVFAALKPAETNLCPRGHKMSVGEAFCSMCVAEAIEAEALRGRAE